MRKWIVLALVAALALTVVPLALAGNGHGWARGKNKFQLVGTVSAVDGAAGTLTVKVKAGSRTIKAYRGLDLTISVPVEAKVRMVVGGEAVAVALADLTPGSKIKVGGRIDRTDPASPVYIGKRMLAKTLAPAPEPTEPPDPDPTEPPAPVE